MKIKTLYNSNEEITLESYLNKHGIDDVEKYLDFFTVEDSEKYVNMDKAKEVFEKCVQIKPTYLLIDPDVDGYTSSSLLNLWIKENFNIKPQLIFHNSPKAHRLNDVIDDILKLPKGLLIIPDASINDVKECKILKESGFEILILDHHLKLKENSYATIVHNNIGEINHDGSACLVVWHFCNYIIPNSVNKYISYVMLSLIADVMPMNNYENSTFIYHGRENIHDNIKPFIEKFQRYTESNRDFSFGVISKINAVIRYGSQDLKEKVFLALCGELEFDESLSEEMKEIHTKQNEDKDKLSSEILSKVNSKENFILYKLESPTPISGLVANKILGETNKTTMLLSEKDGMLGGSFRSKINLHDLMMKSGLCKEVVGHEMAGGLFFKKENEEKIVEYLSYCLSQDDYTPQISITQSYSIKDIPHSLYGLFEPYNHLWGKGLEKPRFMIEDIYINSKDISICGANKRTLRFKIGNVTFIKFQALRKDKEDLRLGTYEDEKFIPSNVGTNLSIKAIGDLSINEWNGGRYKQVIVEEMFVEERGVSTATMLKTS